MPGDFDPKKFKGETKKKLDETVKKTSPASGWNQTGYTDNAFQELDDQVHKNTIQSHTDKIGYTQEGTGLRAGDTKKTPKAVEKNPPPKKTPKTQPTKQPQGDASKGTHPLQKPKDAGGGLGDLNKKGVESTTTPAGSTEGNESVKDTRIWPTVNHIMGLPPIGRSMPIGEHSNDDQIRIFEQSFPILTLKPVTIETSNTNTKVKKGSYDTAPSEGYKFAIQNTGSINMSFSNQYGASQIEEAFTQLADSSAMRELQQFGKVNTILGAATKGALNNLHNEGQKFITQLDSSLQSAVSQKLGSGYSAEGVNSLRKLGGMVVRSAVLGNKIDLPNIWKSSDGKASPTIEIDLRTICVDNDEVYDMYIMKPLMALFALALPCRTNEADGGGVTYWNPPYLTAEIPGIYYSDLCAIASMSIEADFKNDIAMYKNRVRHLKVSLTLQDMYDVFVWAKEEDRVDGVPTQMRILNVMKRGPAKTPSDSFSWLAGSLTAGSKTGGSSGSSGGDIFGSLSGTPGGLGQMMTDFDMSSSLISGSELPMNFDFDPSALVKGMGGFEPSELMKGMQGLGSNDMLAGLDVSGIVGNGGLNLSSVTNGFNPSSILGGLNPSTIMGGLSLDSLGSMKGFNPSDLTSKLFNMDQLTGQFKDPLKPILSKTTTILDGIEVPDISKLSHGLGDIESKLKEQIPKASDIGSIVDKINTTSPNPKAALKKLEEKIPTVDSFDLKGFF